MAIPNQNQDQWTANEWEKRVLGRMGMNEWSARKLIEEHDFEFRYVDPDVHPRMNDKGVKPGDDGLIFGNRRTHERLFDWFAKELAKFESPAVPAASAAPAKPAARVRPVSSREEFEASKGQLAYEARVAGDSWKVIGAAFGLAKPVINAKQYAQSRGLTWPVASPQAD